MFNSIEKLATLLFAFALIHSFCVPLFGKWSRRYRKGSFPEAFFHLLSEVEVVFGFWAFIFLSLWGLFSGVSPVLTYLQNLNVTEPLFLFCIIILASSRPIVTLARRCLFWLAGFLGRFLKAENKLVQFYILLTIGPLLGSLITEPAAITLVSLLIVRMLNQADQKFLYGTLALLFVNISVGGGLTHFAAPPILIVAQKWNWDISSVFNNIGKAALLSVFINTTLFFVFFKNKLRTQIIALEKDFTPMPIWLLALHVLFLIGMVLSAHHSKVFMGLFLVFVGVTTVTKKFQDGLKYREGFLVAFFLLGLVVFGTFQSWWLEPALTSVGQKTIYFVATLLTGVTDNAALTYLGSQVPSLTESARWALASGALSGGGLSILANAPNPAGFTILSSKFPGNTLHAGKLLIAALAPTVVVVISFLLLGNF